MVRSKGQVPEWVSGCLSAVPSFACMADESGPSVYLLAAQPFDSHFLEESPSVPMERAD